MDMKIGLNVGLQQRLVMTPKLQQALKLLQMPTLELQQVLKQEVLQNPLLEEVDDADMEADEEEPARRKSSPSARPKSRQAKLEPRPKRRAKRRRRSASSTTTTSSRASALGDGFANEEDREDFVERVPVAKQSFVEYLMSQLQARHGGREDARDRRVHRREPRRFGLPHGRSQGDRRFVPRDGRGSRARAQDHPDLRSDRRRRARPQGVPPHPARGEGHGRHPRRAHRPRPFRGIQAEEISRPEQGAQGVHEGDTGAVARHRQAEPEAGPRHPRRRAEVRHPRSRRRSGRRPLHRLAQRPQHSRASGSASRTATSSSRTSSSTPRRRISSRAASRTRSGSSRRSSSAGAR